MMGKTHRKVGHIMTTNGKIRLLTNEQYNSTEVYFPEKPNAKVIQALKTVKYRWNHQKQCWYGFLTAAEVKDIIINPQNAQALAEKKAKERAEMWAKKRAEKAKKAETKADTVEFEVESVSAPKKSAKKAETKAETKATPKAKKAETELNFDDVKKASRDYSAKQKKAEKSKK